MTSEHMQYEDLPGMLCGQMLGLGIHRKVGVLNPDPSLVIECAREAPNANVGEEESWQMVKDTPIATWFAPCVAIRPCGMFLLQKRVETRPRSEYPSKFPR